MSKSYTVMELEAIKYLCKCVNSVASLPADLIADTNVATNTTYSSYKIDAEMSALENDLDVLTTSFNNLVTSVEKKIDKDKIVTVLDDTVTNEQVIGALTLKEELDKVFQNVDNGKDLIASAITDKGINTSKDDTFETMANNINSIDISGGIDSIHTAMIDLGYSFTDLNGIDSDKTAHIISKWFVLKSVTDNVDTILDVANTDTFTDWVTDDEITDFGDYINPNYSATQLTLTKDATTGLFVSEELAVHELYTINEG